MEIERKSLDFLKEWKTRSTRKPLIVRGARLWRQALVRRDDVHGSPRGNASVPTALASVLSLQ